MRNDAIADLRVRSRITTGCHVSDSSPDGYYSVIIPLGVEGSLTGDIAIYSEGVDEQACEYLANDAERVKQALKRNILPDEQEAINRGLNYWQQTQTLVGDDLLASRIALVVKWDRIYEQEPETLNCPSYIPWLKLIE